MIGTREETKELWFQAVPSSKVRNPKNGNWRKNQNQELPESPITKGDIY